MEIGEKVAENVNKLLQINNFTSECISMVFERVRFTPMKQLGKQNVTDGISAAIQPETGKFYHIHSHRSDEKTK